MVGRVWCYLARIATILAYQGRERMTEKSEHIIRREHYVAGREDERERIIALLESLKCACDGECGMVEAPFTVLRKLIKGENE